jgi:recombination protein U
LSKNKFEDDMKVSGNKQIFIHRQRDVFIPPECRQCKDKTGRPKIMLPKNPFDFLIYKKPDLILCELKSTKQKSISLDEKIIKKHQTHSLQKFEEYEGITCGFIFNFYKYNNQTYFLHIDDFVRFIENTTRKSMSLDYCSEYGILIENTLKKVNFKYNLGKLFEDINKLSGVHE